MKSPDKIPLSDDEALALVTEITKAATAHLLVKHSIEIDEPVMEDLADRCFAWIEETFQQSTE